MRGVRQDLVRAVLAASVVAMATTVASGGFIIEDEPVEGGSWTQTILAVGPFDFIGFQFLSGSGGPFEAPGGITDFVDPSTGNPVTTWSPFTSISNFATASGPTVSSLYINLNFVGLITDPVTFRGVAFDADGAFLFSNTFTRSGFGFMRVADNDVWQPEQGELIPLPPAVWLGSLGLLAALGLRRRIK